MKALVWLLVCAVPSWALAPDPGSPSPYPDSPPVRERTFAVDDHAGWTLQTGDSAVPLVVVATPGRVVVALAGGWVVLGPDLDVLPSSFDFLGTGQPGSPWAQGLDGAVVSVTGIPGSLAVVYPDTAVSFREPVDVPDLSFFTVTNEGFLFVQGRRVSSLNRWDQAPREGQPLPFFPGDVASAADGTPWAVDSLQARPWKQDEGYWRPLDVPQTSGRLTSLAPFPDSTGYFGGGPGWVGAFSTEGLPLWVRTTDFGGHPLPRDLKLRSEAGRLYLWSAQARKVWAWAWNPQGPQGPVAGLGLDQLPDLVRAEIARLEALGSVPEAEAVAQYGVNLARASLKAQPFSLLWAGAAQEFAHRHEVLKQRVVGAGVLTLQWSAPYGSPLASWTWEPDAAWTDVKGWVARAKPYWAGRPYEAEEFKFALQADRTPWPGVKHFHETALELPSWVNVELRPEGTDDPVHWTRVLLPVRAAPYDLPVE